MKQSRSSSVLLSAALALSAAPALVNGSVASAATLPTPKITGISPRSGGTAGGTKVTVTGAHFTHVYRVLFGKTAGTHLHVLSTKKLVVHSPKHASGRVNVRVVLKSGSTTTHSAKTSLDLFTFRAPAAPACTGAATGIAFVDEYSNKLEEQCVGATKPFVIAQLPAGRFDGPPVWSPDGHRLAVSVGGTNHSANLVLVTAGTGAVKQLTTGSDVEDTDPAWSPDSARLIFSRATFISSSGAYTEGRLWEINADGSNGHALLQTCSGESNPAGDWPAWSPDGSTVLYYGDGCGDDSAEGLFAVNPDGSGLRELVDTGLGQHDPIVGFENISFSPDGTTIAFGSGGTCQDCTDIYTAKADGSDITDVTAAHQNAGCNGNNFSDPTWSPDGTRLAYHTSDDAISSSCPTTDDGVATSDSSGGNFTLFAPDTAGTAYEGAAWQP